MNKKAEIKNLFSELSEVFVIVLIISIGIFLFS